jgi:hypothetical protein
VAQLGVDVMTLNGRGKTAADEIAKNSTAQVSDLLSD